MAKRRKKKVVPVVKRRRKVQIETDDYSFWVEYKSPSQAKLIPITSELAQYGNIDDIKETDIDLEHSARMMPLVIDVLADCITAWEIDSEPDIEAINDLPIDVQTEMMDKILSYEEQEKN